MNAAHLVTLLLSFHPFLRNDPATVRGTKHLEAGRNEEALADFDKALAQNPKSGEAHYNKALALTKLGRTAEAQASFAQAQALDQSLAAKVHYNLGTIAAQEKRIPEALKEYRQSLRIDPRDEDARRNYELLLRYPDAGPPDGGAPDGGNPDSGEPDGGNPDGGSPDGGSPDSGQGEGKDSQGDAGNKPEDSQKDGGSKGKDAGNPGDDKRDNKDQGPDAGGTDGGRTGEQQEGGRKDGGLTPDEALRMLDSEKPSERFVQPWQFDNRERKKTTHGKNW